MAARDSFPKARVSTSHYFVTFARGERIRCLALRPWALYAIAGVFPLCALLMASASLVFVMRDGVINTLFERQHLMQQAYEDRLADMRAQLDRVSSRQLLDQNSLEGKMHDLVTRQAKLESRSEIVANLAERLDEINRTEIDARTPLPPRRPRTASPERPSDRTRDGAPAQRAGSGAAPGLPPQASSYAPVSQTRAPAIDALGSVLTPRQPRPHAIEVLGDEAASPALRPGPRSAPRGDVTGSIGDAGLRDPYVSAIAANRQLPVELRLRAVAGSLNDLESAQIRRIAVIGANALGQAQRLRRAVAATGLEPDQIKPPARAAEPADSATGGPFVPLDAGADASLFEQTVSQAQQHVAEALRLEQLLAYLPVRKPLTRGATQTSGFGRRTDPFTGRPALHTGVDFRQHPGAPVLAAAAGTIVRAEYAGGYGNLVEIEHAEGLTTRYAHLSRIHVRQGEWVPAGHSVGAIGSTGRSTGPHLHYEVRLDGRALDPARFLAAGAKLAAH